MSSKKRLGVGFVGSGFITKFHLQSWLAVRDADVLGIWSPNAANAAETAAWMSRQGYTSLRIVTSNWHMPRSLLEFRETMPDVRLIPNPVFHPEVKMEQIGRAHV